MEKKTVCTYRVDVMSGSRSVVAGYSPKKAIPRGAKRLGGGNIAYTEPNNLWLVVDNNQMVRIDCSFREKLKQYGMSDRLTKTRIKKIKNTRPSKVEIEYVGTYWQLSETTMDEWFLKAFNP